MRRSKCEVSDPREIQKILESVTIGRLATIDPEGFPYVTPVNFVYFDARIYFHSALEGEKLDNLRANPKVGFEVDCPLAYLEVAFNPERLPCRAHQLYRSVIIRGEARIVLDDELKTNALNRLLAKHEKSARFDYVTPQSPGYAACHVVAVRPVHMTAKADLAQAAYQSRYRRFIAERLLERGLPNDLETIKLMGYDLVEDENGGATLKPEKAEGER